MSARGLLRSCVAGAALCFSTAAFAASASATWANLWWTRDQQGQRLLQSDQPAEAARRFGDPRRAAYADLRARQYAQAAQLLAPFRDARSQYNRGNALARSGRLPDALRAYDAALAQSPHDRDARHNRDLVARALRQSAQQHGQSGNAAQRPGGAQQGNSGNNGNSGSSGSSGKNGNRGNSGTQNSDAGRNQPRQGSAPHGGAQPQGSDQSEQQAHAAQPAQPAQSSQSAQAARVAAAHANAGHGQSAASSPAQQGASNALGALGRPPTRDDSASKPPSEQALSLEQWLRRIPDDPGGLLRRKFQIEHLMRQRDAAQ
ncbi:MAG: hypothetical protein ACREU2_06255 [Steroidobacteraceae bacterium]